MKTITFTEFRKNASQVLDLVENGESIRVLRHGKAIAKIVPAEAHEPKPAWKRPGLRLVASGASLSRAVLEERRRVGTRGGTGERGVWHACWAKRMCPRSASPLQP